ncbi:MAG: hypothetical protein UX87_C0027G0011 [Candidatus Amesbacteria bacterium GW2011_GWA1_47_16]|uniref:Uncharacterized protein n=3 Tax=Candidatus Amesiibacteriota TaxID=1752730 RepID=A0A0G1S2A2_9BACT|nr:MAG: hypothetical protein UX87_C0027G0011 [Candidatus Amesbacteria bacterium GW2011_GWA1_47_16]KKU63614.1 MAG: hypothetical protein UX86_C0020G0005 [Candidatus Amesbacteria bacterium GW2011_GWC1_47_15]KKU96667.1 MAG: hypothetical protein UY28_C0031G0011 [Candidatus Amesbacteria bacterium GW2011_GWB1_48_13]
MANREFENIMAADNIGPTGPTIEPKWQPLNLKKDKVKESNGKNKENAVVTGKPKVYAQS